MIQIYRKEMSDFMHLTFPPPIRTYSESYISTRRNKSGKTLVWNCNFCPYVFHEQARVWKHQLECEKNNQNQRNNEKPKKYYTKEKVIKKRENRNG